MDDYDRPLGSDDDNFRSFDRALDHAVAAYWHRRYPHPVGKVLIMHGARLPTLRAV